MMCGGSNYLPAACHPFKFYSIFVCVSLICNALYNVYNVFQLSVEFCLILKNKIKTIRRRKEGEEQEKKKMMKKKKNKKKKRKTLIWQDFLSRVTDVTFCLTGQTASRDKFKTY